MNKGEFIGEITRCILGMQSRILRVGLYGSTARLGAKDSLDVEKDIDLIFFLAPGEKREPVIMGLAKFSLRTGLLIHPLLVDDENSKDFVDSLAHREISEGATFFINEGDKFLH